MATAAAISMLDLDSFALFPESRKFRAALTVLIRSSIISTDTWLKFRIRSAKANAFSEATPSLPDKRAGRPTNIWTGSCS